MRISARIGARTHEITVERLDGIYVVEVDGVRREVDARKLEGNFYTILIEDRSYEISVEQNGDRYHVRHGAAEQVVTLTDPGRAAREAGAAGPGGAADVTTVMPGRVVRVLVDEGDEVRAGQGLVVVEAMKMENEITSPKDGTVACVKVQPGLVVESGATLLIIE